MIMLYSLNDICVIPAVVSNIKHRSSCNPYMENGMLPLFTAPMSSVINQHNYSVFQNNKINTIIPRTVPYDERLSLCNKTFVAFGLSEAEKLLDLSPDDTIVSHPLYVCIDIANGHMKCLIDLCTKLKNMFNNKIILMAGNIANPDTYTHYALAGVDYIRCGVGGGSACLTSANTSIAYPMGSLIKEICSIRASMRKMDSYKYKSIPYIVADGGFDNYDKIIKALAIGADYVMIGKLFAQCEEACGEVVIERVLNKVIDTEIINNSMCQVFRERYSIVKNRKYYGMSTKRAQSEMGNSCPKTAEGIETVVPIKHTLSGWCENFVDYLRSAMSYTNSLDLEAFKNVEIKLCSSSGYMSYYK